jgi:hypothetical protein
MLFAWFFLVSFFLPSTSFSQEGRVDQYTVTNIGTGFTPITGTATGSGDSYVASVSLPFDFNYDNQAYSAGTSIRFGTDGWLEFAGSQPSSSPYVDRVANTSYNYPRSIYVFSQDMNVTTGMYYTTLGSAPNRIFVVEYRDTWGFGSSTSYTKTSMQIRLHETSNVIELHYKHNSLTLNKTGSAGLHGHTSPSLIMRRIYGPSSLTPSQNIRCTPPIKPTQRLAMSPESINFGSIAAGQPSADFPVTLTNIGAVTNLVINSAIVSGTADFTVVSSPASNIIAPGASATYMLRFRPLAPNTRNGVFTVATNGLDSGTQTVNLTGYGIAPEVSYGVENNLFRKSRVRMDESYSQSFTITSTGNGALAVNSIQITGDYANQYSITRAPLASMPPGWVDTVTVTYTPMEEGLRNAELVITTDAFSNPVKKVTLHGTGILPRLVMTPSTVMFDSVAMGDTAWATVRLSNPGTDTLAVKADYVTFADRDFTYYGLENGDSLIAPERFRDVQIRFIPSTRGSRQARARFLTNIPRTFEDVRRDTSTFILDVQGVAVPYGLLSIDAPSTIDSAIIGTQTCETVTIWNNGQSPLIVNSATIAGPDAADFTLTGVTFPLTIAPQSSVDAQVCATPSVRGMRTAMVDVSATSQDRVTTVQLPLAVYGLAVCAQPSTTTAFENEIVLVNTSSTAQVLINNCGDVARAYTAVVAGEGYSLTGAATSSMIAPGDNATFELSFNPTVMSSLPGTLTVTADGITPIVVNLAGTGGNVLISRMDNFQPVTAVGSTSPEFSVTVKNTGNMELTPGEPTVSNTAFAYVAGSGPAMIAAGSEGTFKFTFAPTNEGVTTAAVSFPNASPTLQGGFMLSGSTPTGAVRPVTQSGYELGQNYPNPFNPSTVITFTMAEAGIAKIIVTDITGNVVTTVADQFFGKGENRVTFDASNIASGTYFYELVANGVRLQRSMLLNK